MVRHRTGDAGHDQGDKGAILAVGHFTDLGRSITKSGDWTTECRFTAYAYEVPSAPFYSVDLGRRGSVQFSKSDLAATNWVAEISIGD